MTLALNENVDDFLTWVAQPVNKPPGGSVLRIPPHMAYAHAHPQLTGRPLKEMRRTPLEDIARPLLVTNTDSEDDDSGASANAGGSGKKKRSSTGKDGGPDQPGLCKSKGKKPKVKDFAKTPSTLSSSSISPSSPSSSKSSKSSSSSTSTPIALSRSESPTPFSNKAPTKPNLKRVASASNL